MLDATELARWLVLVVFVLTWLGISARRVELLPIGRPAIALVGAVALVVIGQFAGPHGLGVDEALRAIEPQTLALLFGMMVVAAALAEAGFFAVVTERLADAVRRPAVLLWAVTVGAGLLSAVLVNDAVCLLATPLVVALVRRRGLPVRPFLFALAMGANAGSALTLSGNPQNMLVAKLSGLAYRDYLASAALPALGALVATAGILHMVFRADLVAAADAASSPPVPSDRLLLRGALLALAALVVANLLGATLALSALAAAAWVLLLARRRAESLLAQVDWSVLLFFASLFVVVAALQRTGLPSAWLEALTPAADSAGRGPGFGTLIAVLLLGSQAVSNVPLILLLEPWIRSFADAPLAWTLTALVSTLAGNLTLLGSVANIIVIERAKERLGFFEYLRVGVVVTTASTAVAVGLLLLLR
ncbi:MAG: arsenic transporter [Deltaproteobacteria bacterium]|nr:arsenic transporter [Deltaproteobacteria bacterium]